MFSIYVLWSLDGPSHLTCLVYEELVEQRRAMESWSTQDYVAQAFDAEYPGEENPIKLGESYDCQAIFEAKGLRVIY